MKKKGVTKERILEEFRKAHDFGVPEGVPKTLEDMDRYITDIVRSERFVGKSIVFVFDKGPCNDRPRYLHLEYFLTKEDVRRARGRES